MRSKWTRHLTNIKAALLNQNLDEIQNLLNERKSWDKDEFWTRDDITLLEKILESDKAVSAWMEKEKADLHQFLLGQSKINKANEKYRQG